MLKRLVTTLIVSAFLAAPAFAQAVNENSECTKAAADLISAAEAKQLSDDRLDRIEELLGKMEDLCDADKVAEAMDVAKDIEREINAQ